MSQSPSKVEHQRKIWAAALTLPGQPDLQTSLVAELAEYLVEPVEQVERRCRRGAAELAQAWWDDEPATQEAISAFYRRVDIHLYDLTWWHTLSADDSALVQVEALEAALAHHATTALDFGSGIGSLGILLAQRGLAVTLADVNLHLNDYARWRFGRRGLSADFLDLNVDPLPANAFDFISAVDVFEHLPDPGASLYALASALQPGGTLFIHLPPDSDLGRPMHLWHDPDVLLKHLPDSGLWLERADGSTLILRRGVGPRYALSRGVELRSDENGVILLSTRPLIAFRLNPQSYEVLRRLNTHRTVGELAAESGQSLLGVTTFLDTLTRRRILTRRPSIQVVSPFVSIIIPARGRPVETRACVESLLALDYPADRFEIILVDDASEPPLDPALAGLPVKCLRQEANVGQSAARNLAAVEACGDLLAFIDNDCVADSGWLGALVPHLDDPAMGIVGGRVLAPPPEGRVAAFEAVRSPLDMGARGGEVGPGEAVAYLPTCNLIVRQELMDQLGGFDVGMALGEDVDFILRARRAGWRATYEPEGRVIHRHRVQLGALLRRRADYGSSEADLQRRHPEGRRVMVLPFAWIMLLAALTMFAVSGTASLVLLALSVGSIIIELIHKLRLLRQAEVRLPVTRVSGAILREHGAALYHLGANVTRYYSLIWLAAGILWPPLFLPAVLLFFVTPLTDYRRLHPRLSLPVFVGLYWLEMGAYQVGLWHGCMKWRTLRPLLPTLQLGR